MPPKNPQSDLASAILSVSVSETEFTAIGREQVVMDLLDRWWTRNPRLREMTAQLTQAANALEQAISRADKET